MDAQKMLKIKVTADTLWDDLLDLISLPLVKALLWLISMTAAFSAGLAL
jgi:hypothetical protein